MGQGQSCRRPNYESDFISAVEDGYYEVVEAMVKKDPSVLTHITVHERLSGLHIAAANGQIQILSLLLDSGVDPDVLNRYKQTPLMVAAMHGEISCVEKLIEAGANILVFDAHNGRTCLHYAAYYGHRDCLQAIISAANSTPVCDSWGFARYVNIRDGHGETPLHLAARRRRHECLHLLLVTGALVSASTGESGRYPGSTPLHLAARAGSLNCIRDLLAWGANRLHHDAAGRIPFVIALKHKHRACAALLNPSSAEPLVWPSSLKVINELNPEAKVLLEKALMEANKEREKAILKDTAFSVTSPSHSDVGLDDCDFTGIDTELCCICYDQICAIEVQDCGHQMCAHCTLALCCHNKKPNQATTCPAVTAPLCPFCRGSIKRLAIAKTQTNDSEISVSKAKGSKKSRHLSKGSNSFKSLLALGSFGRVSGKIDTDVSKS